MLGAFVIAAVAVGVSLRAGPNGDGDAPGVGGAALVAASALALGLGRWWPSAMFATVASALVAYIALGFSRGPILLIGLVGLASLRWNADRRAALSGVVVLAAGLAVAWALAGDDPRFAVFYLGWSITAVFLAEMALARHDRVRALEERARSLERTREEELRRRIAEDRLRIARDLHDGVAHALATITVQAGAAARVIDAQPDVARGALLTIRSAGAELLDELGAMLAALRQDDGDQPPSRAPRPGLAALATLVATTRERGHAVAMRTDGRLDDVPDQVQTAAYGIAREALANASRHAPGSTIDVEARRDPAGRLRVAITNDGGAARARGAPGTGVGLRGMRERAAATGGSLDAAVTERGGFRVIAEWEAPR
ncbi:MAG TPA: histidine kinase [Baekduia sp.]|nr:histidine kinase [Baekduia sp.]